MKEDKQKVIIVLLMINILLICYFGISITGKLDNRDDVLLNQINNVSNSVANLENSVSENIQSVLEARYNMIDTTEYKYANIDAVNHKATINLSVNLKTVKPNSRIYLAYSEIDANNVQEIEMTKKEGISYGASVEWNLNKNYQYDVIERIDGGGEALLNSNKQYLYLYNEFYENRVQMLGSGSGRSNEQLDLDYSFSVNDFGMEEFGLDRVLLEVGYEGKVIDSIDITDRIASGTGSDMIDQYKIAIASGEIDASMSIKEFEKNMGFRQEDKNDTRTYYSYTHSIHYDTDYPEQDLDLTKAENMTIKLIITCKDGYQHTY